VLRVRAVVGTLSAAALEGALSESAEFFRQLAQRFVSALCALPRLEEAREEARAPLPSQEAVRALLDAAPPMRGAEYLTPEVLARLWEEMQRARSAVAPLGCATLRRRGSRP
jgi:hypothetical protein